MAEFLNGDLRKFVFQIVKFEKRWYINLRQWGRYDPRNEKAWRPTKKGISIPLALADEFKEAIAQTLIELDERQKKEIEKIQKREVKNEKGKKRARRD